jgi:hypothetical protein
MPVPTLETARPSDDERRQLEALLANFDESWTEQSVTHLPDDLHTTQLALLGLDHEKLVLPLLRP